MKRVGYLYDKVCSCDNVKQAIINASKGKRKRFAYIRILNNLDKYANYFSNILKNKEYSPRTYKKFTIIDGSTNKIREINKPSVYDHIIQHCLMNVIKPYLEKGMDFYCCCNVKGRGSLVASLHARNGARNYKYCLKLDIHHFFQSIDKNILYNKCKDIFKDKDILDLIYKIIFVNSFIGLPIGTYPSQIFSNFYLKDFDRFCREKLKVKFMVRYMDDIVIMGNNKRKLKEILEEISKYLKNNLNLLIKKNYQIFNVRDRPIDFCGYKVFQKYTTIRRKIFKRFRRAIMRFNIKRITSYLGYVRYSNSFMVYNKYIKGALIWNY